MENDATTGRHSLGGVAPESRFCDAYMRGTFETGAYGAKIVEQSSTRLR